VLRKGFVVLLAISLGLSSWLTDSAAAAGTSSSKLKQIQQNKKKAEAELNKTRTSLKEQEQKVKELEARLGKLTEELSQHQKRLADNQKRLEAQETRFKAILVRMYEKGDTQYLVHLLSAESFSEFLQRFETLRLITNNERSVLDDYLNIKKDIQKEIAAVQQEQQQSAPLLAEAKKELAEYEKLYKQNKSRFEKLEQEEELTKEAIEEKNRLVRSASAGGNYGTGQLAWPQPGGKVTSGFGWRNGRKHEGIDIANSLGSPIVAADDGVVVLMKSDPGGYGYYIVIDHGGGLKTLYAHMYPSTVRVSTGQRVYKGQRIASVGNNGRSTGPHLHFETHKNGTPVDPMRYY
jgi:murein DD-endopeptidase MepM/ murein hydrolase activator NlpD